MPIVLKRENPVKRKKILQKKKLQKEAKEKFCILIFREIFYSIEYSLNFMYEWI